MSSSVLVRARALTKRFDGFTAVDSIDFDVNRGEVFGFLGPNGAGKSSTMRMIGATSPVTSGALSVFGLDPASDGREIRARLGVVPQENSLDEELSVAENLYIYGRYFGIRRDEVRRRIDDMLAFAQLTDRRSDKVDALSGGMKRRLTIARALVNHPEMLILDEPTTGLDPQARHLLWDRLYRLKREGVTLIITTHYMDEAEQLCDRLVVMDGGRIVAEGAPQALIDTHVRREVVEVRLAERAEEGRLVDSVVSADTSIEVLPDRILLATDEPASALEAVGRSGVAVASTLVRRATLEDVFLALTGRTLVE